ncbi:hypothetical protein BAUCODRAFT_331208 [Baudoinia panamericana UAMH 10762]|uniref:Uncharacterized protein n=1 Tax=Baudoinia panamericana (strain UAMH 10762) TaxID=717646 RepID=M2MWE8_BAUPA|nr:uncharacterized protein BAUCODRAFT_331208 [Baudoinia panamericana UAMH 10762]EMC90909.1 hypothetical protein BAUCODRAFT_331208 [Baudoinia panamericana UAMH 10762]
MLIFMQHWQQLPQRGTMLNVLDLQLAVRATEAQVGLLQQVRDEQDRAFTTIVQICRILQEVGPHHRGMPVVLPTVQAVRKAMRKLAREVDALLR